MSASTLEIETSPVVGESGEVVLEVKNLKTYFFTEDGVVQAVNGVNFKVKRGEVLALVGESGCGKSVTSFSIMRLVGIPGRILEGEVIFDGQDLLKVTEEQMTHLRGNRMAMIFQQPTSCLNPVFRVGEQIAEVLDIHYALGKEAGKKRAIELLRDVKVPDPERRIQAYPHELSGGMAQRVMIAMALACVPELLIADEPTTALDVTIQAQILHLMRELRSKLGTAIILITHDLGVVAEMADDVAVMYAGQIVEQAPVNVLFSSPKHPYTVGLMGSIPLLTELRDRLDIIPGSVPNLIGLPPGCPFAPRCRQRVENESWLKGICRHVDPDLKPVGDDHGVACWLFERDEVERLQSQNAYPVAAPAAQPA